jgi:hypothetical protein
MYKRRGVGKGAGQQNGPRNMDLLEIGTGRTAEVEVRMGCNRIDKWPSRLGIIVSYKIRNHLKHNINM